MLKTLRKLYTLHWGDFLMVIGIILMVVGVREKLSMVVEKEVVEFKKSEEVLGKVSGVVNINKANLRELVDLPGIGEKIGQRIIDYREAYGPFKSKGAIKQVSGIGEKTYENLKEKIAI